MTFSERSLEYQTSCPYAYFLQLSDLEPEIHTGQTENRRTDRQTDRQEDIQSPRECSLECQTTHSWVQFASSSDTVISNPEPRISPPKSRVPSQSQGKCLTLYVFAVHPREPRTPYFVFRLGLRNPYGTERRTDILGESWFWSMKSRRPPERLAYRVL